DDNTVTVIDGSTNTVVATVSVGAGKNPVTIAENTETNIVYIVNQAGNSVTLLDGSSNTLSSTVGVDNSPQTIAIDQTTNMVYVGNFRTRTVSVLVEPDFVLRLASPRLTVARGKGGQITVNINRSGGFSDNVTVTAPNTSQIKVKLTPPTVSTTSGTAV